MPDSAIAKKKKRSSSLLVQLVIVAGLVAVVWFSFGQNVLAPGGQLSAPERLGTLELIGSIDGPEALAQITEVYGIDIELVSVYIADYVYGNERVTVWVGVTESSAAGAELTRRMFLAIEDGGSPFSNPRQLSIAVREVFQVDGPGGEHFFYNSTESGDKVVWLSIEAVDALSIMEEAVRTF